MINGWNSLNLATKTQLISAISTALAAIAALITTLQNSKLHRQMDQERHVTVKPTFIVLGTSEQSLALLNTSNYTSISISFTFIYPIIYWYYHCIYNKQYNVLLLPQSLYILVLLYNYHHKEHIYQQMNNTYWLYNYLLLHL